MAITSVTIISANLATFLPPDNTVVRAGWLATEWQYIEKSTRCDSKKTFMYPTVRSEPLV